MMSCNKSTGGRSSRKSRNKGTSISASESVLNEKKFSQLPAFYINEIDRMVSDQGLTAAKRRPNIMRRRIKDKAYYKGEIHLKNKKINDEIKKLQKEIGLLSIDQAMYLPNRKIANEKAMELQNLQETLANYKIVDDLLISDVQLKEAEKELQNLKIVNKKENAEVEKLFNVTKQKELILKELENDLSQENNVTEILTTTITPQLYEKYKELKQMDDKLEMTRIKQEKELKALKKGSTDLENECNKNKYLAEALGLIKKLCQRENERDGLLNKKTFASASEEREHLQKYRKEFGDLLKCLTQEISNLDIKIKDITAQLKNAESEESNSYNERIKKCSELKKRECVIDKSLSSFRDQQLALLTEQQQLHCKVIQLLNQIASKRDFSPSNIDSINIQNKNVAELKCIFLKLTSDLDYISNIEEKYQEELKVLNEEIARKKKGIPTFRNLKNAKEKLKIRERELTNKLKAIKKQKRNWKFILDDLQKRHDLLENKLRNKETYVKLSNSNLENQSHLLEKENYSMEKIFAFKNSQESYLLVKEEVRKIYLELNKML